MTYKDIQDALATLNRLSIELEDQYIESEGEVTEATEEMEARKAAVQDLLQNDGIDSLGRWLKTKEDEVKMWKAEKAAADRKVKSAQNTVDFVKAKIAEVMAMTGMDKAKGAYYSFSKYASEKSAVDQEELERIWLDVATSAAHDAGLPAYVDVLLKTTTTALKEWGATDFIQTSTADAVRFTKPRGAKE